MLGQHVTIESHLCLVHVAIRQEADEDPCWQGQILHLVTGEVRFFDSQESLIRSLMAAVHSTDAS
jgi:hypothetical protein